MSESFNEMKHLDDPDDALPGYIRTASERHHAFSKTEIQLNRPVSRQVKICHSGKRDYSQGLNGAFQTKKLSGPVSPIGTISSPHDIDVSTANGISSFRSKSDNWIKNTNRPSGHPDDSFLHPNFIADTDTRRIETSQYNPVRNQINRITILDAPTETRQKKRKNMDHMAALVQASPTDGDGMELSKLGPSEIQPSPTRRNTCTYTDCARPKEIKKKSTIRKRSKSRQSPVKYAECNRNDIGKSAEKHKSKFASLMNFVKIKDKKVSYCKVCPFDDGTKPNNRSSKQLADIAAMFCVEKPEDAEKRRAAKKSVEDTKSSDNKLENTTEDNKIRKAFVYDDDDDDDYFRPGVWNCSIEFKRPEISPEVVEDKRNTNRDVIISTDNVDVVSITIEEDVTEVDEDIREGCFANFIYILRRIFKIK